MADNATLRIAVLCGQRSIQRWQAEAVTQLLTVPGVQPVVWIALQQEEEEAGADPARNTAGKSKKKGTGILARLAQWLPQQAHHQALTTQDPVQFLGAVRTVPVGTHDGILELSAKDVNELQALQLDLVLVLSGLRPDGRSVGHPRLGVWGFHPTLSAEGIEEDLFSDATAPALQLLRDDANDKVVVLREARFAANGIDAPVDAALMSCAQWPAQVAREILSGATEAASGMPDAALAEEIMPQGSFGAVGAVWEGIRRKMARPQPPSSEEWNIGVLHQPITALLEENASTNVRWLPPPSSGRSRSEPFGYTTEDGQLNVLYRKHGGSSGQSSIARLRPKTDNILKRSRPMLEGAGITGYPYVVEHEGSVYVVVTHLTGTDLYRLNEANDGLDHVTVLIGRPLYAPTLFRAHERWWLFATDTALPDSALLAFHADRPTGPFTAHPLNPLKLDARSARPAGTPFESGGTWWRPALDATDPDMYTVVLNRITTLTPELFAEETVKRLEPFRGTSYGHGLRTLCAMGPITLVDGLRSPLVAANKANTSRGKRRGSSSKHK